MQREDLAKLTRKALLAIAKDHGVKGVGRLHKQDLIERLVQALPSALRATPLSSPAPTSSSLVSSKKKQEANSQSKRVALPSSAEFVSGRASDAYAPEQTEEPAQTQHATAQNKSTAHSAAQAAVESKFFLGPQHGAPVSEPEALPASYDDNRVVLLARDPHWLYAYWDFSGTHLSAVQSQLAGNDPCLVLRVFDVTYLEFNGVNAWNATDIELTPFATNWYFSVPQAEAAYCTEIGYRSRSGQFVPLGRSNVVTTPRAEISLSMTVRWLIPPERRMTTRLTGYTPRSTFAHEDSSGVPSQNSTAAFSPPSSEEHPFSWGASHKFASTPPSSKEHE